MTLAMVLWSYRRQQRDLAVLQADLRERVGELRAELQDSRHQPESRLVYFNGNLMLEGSDYEWEGNDRIVFDFQVKSRDILQVVYHRAGETWRRNTWVDRDVPPTTFTVDLEDPVKPEGPEEPTPMPDPPPEAPTRFERILDD